jgi:hypothetical protein
MSTTNFTQLREQIDQTFDEEEVRNLCSEIGVDYDNLGGRGKVANVRELLAHCQRHNRQAK